MFWIWFTHCLFNFLTSFLVGHFNSVFLPPVHPIPITRLPINLITETFMSSATVRCHCNQVKLFQLENRKIKFVELDELHVTVISVTECIWLCARCAGWWLVTCINACIGRKRKGKEKRKREKNMLKSSHSVLYHLECQNKLPTKLATARKKVLNSYINKMSCYAIRNIVNV